MGEEKQSITKNLLLVVGFIATIAAIAGAVYAAIKYFENKNTEEASNIIKNRKDGKSQ